MSLADRAAEGASSTSPAYTLILHKKIDAFACRRRRGKLSPWMNFEQTYFIGNAGV
jgi:hypothetical protein